MHTVKTAKSRNIVVCFILSLFIMIISQPVKVSAQAAKISVVSNPVGADVYVGAKSINRIVNYETGRHVGKTPLTVFLTDSDVSMEGENNAFANIHVEVKKNGYIPYDYVINLGEYGKVEPGKMYEVDVNLHR